MQSEPNYPLRFEPIFMERLWGGRRLESVLGKRLPPGKRIGESWEISDHGSWSTTIANGPLRGTSLRDLTRSAPQAMIRAAAHQGGTPVGDGRQFPLLIKWIDAHEKLSIQVHPPDGHPRLPPGESGKTECWFIADADPTAELYIGLRRGIDRQTLARDLARGTVDQCLNAIPAQPGDFLFVPAGTPHAIGAGVLLAEIQQTSDTTFRLWDWNRVDPNTGLPRSLHVEAAIDSIDFNDAPPYLRLGSRTYSPRRTKMLLDSDRCSHFVVAHHSIDSPLPLGESTRFHILICLSGSGSVAGNGTEVTIARGDCLLLPASGPFTCHPTPHLELLDTWVPAAGAER
jgi:mannose-6-phosphate isomerase